MSESAPEPAAARRRRLGAFLSLLGLGLLAFVTGLLIFNTLVMPRLIHGGVEAGPNAVLAFAREGYRKSDVNLADLFFVKRELVVGAFVHKVKAFAVRV